MGHLRLRVHVAASLLVAVPPQDLEGNPWRHRLLELIRGRPGITFKELVAETRITEPNARYHLEVLVRAATVHRLHILHRLCYAPADADLGRVTTEAYLRFDPKLAMVRAKIEGAPWRASELVQRLREELKLSRSAGWKLVDRAVEAGIAERLVHERRLLIRARGDAPPPA